MGGSPTAPDGRYERVAVPQLPLAPATQAQLGPQVQAVPHEQLVVAAGASDLQPQVHSAPIQDAQVQLLETFDAWNMVDSSWGERRLA